MKTSGNTILITGAANGIGLEIAGLSSQKNNKVIMADRSIDQLKTEAAKLDNVVTITVDLTDENDVNKLIQTIKLNHSELNIAILNACAAMTTPFIATNMIWNMQSRRLTPTILQMSDLPTL